MNFWWNYKFNFVTEILEIAVTTFWTCAFFCGGQLHCFNTVPVCFDKTVWTTAICKTRNHQPITSADKWHEPAPKLSKLKHEEQLKVIHLAYKDCYQIRKEMLFDKEGKVWAWYHKHVRISSFCAHEFHIPTLVGYFHMRNVNLRVCIFFTLF